MYGLHIHSIFVFPKEILGNSNIKKKIYAYTNIEKKSSSDHAQKLLNLV